MAGKTRNGSGIDPVLARSPAMFRAFGWYLRWYFHRNFDAVRISRAGWPDLPPGRPAIIFGNHPSWWDPAFFILLSATVLRDRAGFGPMDQASLDQYAFMARLGIFGIDAASARGAVRFLDVGSRVLCDPTAALWITAEGHFTDNRTRPVALRPGLAHLVRRAPDAVLVPLAMEYSFWNERKPVALARFGRPIEAGPQRDTAAWTTVLSAALEAEMDALAAESATRDPALFRKIVSGGSGVGGIYDFWRRGRAWTRGKRVRLSHEAQVE